MAAHPSPLPEIRRKPPASQYNWITCAYDVVPEQLELAAPRAARVRLQGTSRCLGLWLTSESLGLNGKLDLLLERGGQGVVVDLKLTSGELGDNHRMQLSSYAMLVEACYSLRVETAFLYRIPDDRVFAFSVTSAWKQRVTEAISAIQELERTGAVGGV
jgi:CRISPR/Cas system-associated exonuclease Cas4 (RecB family)